MPDFFSLTFAVHILYLYALGICTASELNEKKIKKTMYILYENKNKKGEETQNVSPRNKCRDCSGLTGCFLCVYLYKIQWDKRCLRQIK